MEIQQTSFKMMILFRYSSYRNYLLRYMCINFLGKLMGSDRNYTVMRTQTREDDDEAAVKGNLAKAKKKWASM
jgi:hypothetical protein